LPFSRFFSSFLVSFLFGSGNVLRKSTETAVLPSRVLFLATPFHPLPKPVPSSPQFVHFYAAVFSLAPFSRPAPAMARLTSCLLLQTRPSRICREKLFATEHPLELMILSLQSSPPRPGVLSYRGLTALSFFLLPGFGFLVLSRCFPFLLSPDVWRSKKIQRFSLSTRLLRLRSPPPPLCPLLTFPTDPQTC